MHSWRRRRIALATGLALASCFVRSQAGDRTYRLGVIFITSPLSEMTGAEPLHPLMRGFVHELRALGYVEGRNVVLELRSADSEVNRFPDIVVDLVRLKPDVIVTSAGGRALNLAKNLWGTVPIVMLSGDDPVPWGLASSLGRPGGNVTGVLAFTGPENEVKRLELLKEALPKLSRVAYLGTKAIWNHPLAQAVRHAAKHLHIELMHAEHKPHDLPTTFASIERMHPDALFASAGVETFGQRLDIVAFSLKARLPGSYPFSAMADDGGLMSYGVNLADLGRRAAHYVDKILKGAKPGELAIERPSKFDLVVNLKTAEKLGLHIPPQVLVRADRLIE